MKGYRILAIIFCFTSIISAGGLWTETTQEDFADGVFECNIYSSYLNNGAVEFTSKWDLNHDGFLDIVIADEQDNTAHVYWGSVCGYSPSNKTDYAVINGGDCDAADLNFDGYPELIFTQYTGMALKIFYGTPNGPSPSTFSTIPVSAFCEGCYIADLNKDGFLDIVASRYDGSNGSIFWGSANGYSSANKTLLPAYCFHNIEVADINKDNWLDIVFMNDIGWLAYVYWGSPDGYSPTTRAHFSNPGGNPHGCSLADVNNDGNLEIILNSFCSATDSYIYSYDGSGFVLYQILHPGACYGGSSVSDFNHDDFLDILYFRGYGITQKPIIYWGSQSGYSENNQTEIGQPVDASGGLVADFNMDGNLDVYVDNYAYPPVPSYILMGPNYTPAYSFPNHRDHHGRFREIGNVYNRDYYEDYVSSVLDANKVVDWDKLEWDAVTPAGASVLFWLRSGNTPQPDETWNEWVAVSNGGAIPTNLNAQYLQYKARLAFTYPVYLPSLQEVRVSYSESSVIAAAVRIEPEVINLNSHGRFTAFIYLPAGYNHADIDVATVVCEGAHAVWGKAAPNCYIAKFNIQDLVGVVPGPAVEFTVTGKLKDGTAFSGSDVVKVIKLHALTVLCKPNPFARQTMLTIANLNRTDVLVKIYDLSGRLIRNFKNVDCRTGKGSVIWDRKNNTDQIVPAGVYLLQVQDGSNIYTDKVMVLE